MTASPTGTRNGPPSGTSRAFPSRARPLSCACSAPGRAAASTSAAAAAGFWSRSPRPAGLRSASTSPPTSCVSPGYWDRRLQFDAPGFGDGVRRLAGARHVPLSDLLNAVAGAGLRLDRVEELRRDPPAILAFRAVRA